MHAPVISPNLLVRQVGGAASHLAAAAGSVSKSLRTRVVPGVYLMIAPPDSRQRDFGAVPQSGGRSLDLSVKEDRLLARGRWTTAISLYLADPPPGYSLYTVYMCFKTFVS